MDDPWAPKVYASWYPGLGIEVFACDGDSAAKCRLSPEAAEELIQDLQYAVRKERQSRDRSY